MTALSLARCDAARGGAAAAPRRGLVQILRQRRSPAATSASSCGPARCWASSASPARARRPCSTALSARLRARCRQHPLPPARRHGRRAVRDVGAGAPHADAHRLGHRPSEPARRAAPRRQRRRQCRRAADGGGRAPLRRHPRRGTRLARQGRDRRGADRRPAADLLRRHAAAPADRPQPRLAAAPRASWTSRPAGSTSRSRRGCSTCCAALCAELRSRRDRRDPRSRRRAPAGASPDGDARAARSSKAASPTRCSTIRSTPTRNSSSPRFCNDRAFCASSASPRASPCTTRAARGSTCSSGVDLAVGAGECVVLHGRSGAGKSTLLRAIYGNYLPQGGHILRPPRRRRRRHGGRAAASHPGGPPPHHGLCQPVPARHPARADARHRRRAAAPPRRRRPTRRASAPAPCSSASPSRGGCGRSPPATFSGGEQQRVNIARGLVAELSRPAARRADRGARRREPRGGDRADRDGARPRRRDRRHLPRPRGARGARRPRSSTCSREEVAA